MSRACRFKRFSTILSMAAVLGTACCLNSYAAAGSLRAACIKVDITPTKPVWLQGYPRETPSRGIHDRIYHRIVAVDDAKTQVFLVSSDVTLIRIEVFREFCEELERQTGVKRSQLWWNTTQTHSGPRVGRAVEKSDRGNPEYSAWLKKVLIDGIRQARSKLLPARLGVGVGMSMANINRRAMDVDGHVPYLGMNPDGPVDRQIGLIRLERRDGSPIALIADYAVHGTVTPAEGPPLYLISGDVKGVAAEYVEEKLGAPCLVMSGAEGDVGPIYSTVTLTFPRRQGFDHLDMFKRLLGDRILAANKRIAGTTSEVTLRTGQTIIRTPFRNGIGADWIREAVSPGTTGTTMVSIPVDFLKINEEILIWGAPLELFCEIAMRIRERSPFPYTFFYGLNNGYMSYLTTRAAFVEGGHEVRQTPYTEQAEQDFTAGVLSYAWSLPRRR